MKKITAALLVTLMLFSLTSCKIGEDGQRDISDEAKDIASQIEQLATTKDTSVIENLSEPQKKYFDSLGKTIEGTKLIVYSDSVNFTVVYVFEFVDNKVTKTTTYHLIKNDTYFNVISAGIDAKSKATVDEKNKIIKAENTNEHKDKTYEVILKEFSQYTVVK